VTLCDTVLDVPWHGQNNFRTISSAILDLFSVPEKNEAQIPDFGARRKIFHVEITSA
jgi:hypothetical protein